MFSRSYIDMIKRYYPFTMKEFGGLIVTIAVLTLVAGLDDKSETFVLAHWLGNLLRVFMIVVISVMVHHTGQRLWGFKEGFTVEQYVWWYGIILALAVAFVTRGKIWPLAVTGTMIHHHRIHRLGEFRYGPNIHKFSIVAFAGPISCILLVTFLKVVERMITGAYSTSGFIHALFMFNLGYAAWNLLPIPPLDGSRIFFDSRNIYVLIAVSFWAYFIMALNGIYSYIIALLIGIVMWAIYIFGKKG